MKKKHSLSTNGIIQAAPFLLPSVIGLIIFSFLPIIISLFLSLTNWDGLTSLTSDIFFEEHFIGFGNFKEILGGTELYRLLGNVGYFIILYLPTLLITSIGLAWLLNQNYRSTSFFRVIYYIPVLTSWVAGALIFKWIFAPQFGLMNNILAFVGIEGPAWLQSEQWAMPSIVLASIWKDIGFYALILLAGLKGIDKTYYEAASIDGANGWKGFWKITLPLLSPSIFFVAVMSLINAFQLFTQVLVMTEGGPNGATQVMVERIYTYGFKYYRMGYASALSWILFVIIFAFTAIQMKMQKRWVHYD